MHGAGRGTDELVLPLWVRTTGRIGIEAEPDHIRVPAYLLGALPHAAGRRYTPPTTPNELAAWVAACGAKTANDLSAMTVWGIFSGGDGKAQITRVASANGETISSVSRTYTEEHPRAILMFGWQERLELHDLVTKVADTMRKFKIDKLLIENKAAGHSVAQEIRRLYSHEDFAVQLVDPKGQIGRAHV